MNPYSLFAFSLWTEWWTLKGNVDTQKGETGTEETDIRVSLCVFWGSPGGVIGVYTVAVTMVTKPSPYNPISRTAAREPLLWEHTRAHTHTQENKYKYCPSICSSTIQYKIMQTVHTHIHSNIGKQNNTDSLNNKIHWNPAERIQKQISNKSIHTYKHTYGTPAESVAGTALGHRHKCIKTQSQMYGFVLFLTICYPMEAAGG